jgi:hypothetical protein
LPPPAPRICTGVALLAAFLAWSPLAAAVPDLEAVGETLATATGGGDVAALRTLLPTRSKVFLDLKTPRPVRGYFGANQVVTVFRGILAAHELVELDPPGADGERRSATIRGRLRPREGQDRLLALSFVLRKGKAGWTLREVREGA